MWVVGIDENGLGPLLGPLVVTAAAFETPRYDRDTFWRAVKDILPADDSKKLFSRNSIKSAERATLSWLGAFGIEAVSHEDLAARICPAPPFALPADEPDCTWCAPGRSPLPLWTTAADGDASVEARKSCARSDIRPAMVRSFSVCPGIYNAATADGTMNKFQLDFQLMMELVKTLCAQSASDGELLVLCGKVGSTRYYGPWLEAAGFGAWSVEEEEREISSYRVPGIGKISFIRDGDGIHLPVAVASMVGKYLRELAMYDINCRLALPGVRSASGYRDKVTKEFVVRTEDRRRELQLEDGCFLRNS
jgi:ribonuclease HII